MRHLSECLYCSMPLPKRHEHDHMPVPARHGGKITHCVCMNCHELKDRTRIDHLDADLVQARERVRDLEERLSRARAALDGRP